MDDTWAEKIPEFTERLTRLGAGGDQINQDDKAALARLVRDAGTVIDVGTYLGASAAWMLAHMPDAGRLVTIDTFEGTAGVHTANAAPIMYEIAQHRLAPYGARATIVRGRSPDVAAQFEDGGADLVFLDAAHDYESVMADIAAWRPKVRPGGVLAGHDFDWPTICSDMAPTWDEIVAGSGQDFDKRYGHLGVIRAVMENFENINCFREPKCTVWWTEVNHV